MFFLLKHYIFLVKIYSGDKMNKETIKKELILKMSKKLNVNVSEIEKAMSYKSALGLRILDYLYKEQKTYNKLLKDYLNMAATARTGSAITYVYRRDEKYLDVINETIDEIKANYKEKKEGNKKGR